jgi:hypothetical protein
MSGEQLLFIVLFVLIPLFNVLAKLLRKRRPAPPVPEERVTALPPPRVLHPVPAPSPLPARVTRAGPAEVQAVERRRRVPYRLRSTDVRRGIVLMTILGPCRALEPGASPETRA